MRIYKRKKRWLHIFFFAGIIFSPILSYFHWVLKPKKTIDIIIIDKTVANKQKNEHASFNWLLHNLKIVRKNNRALYSIDDYYGFFPQKNEEFFVSDFEKLGPEELGKILKKNQMIYITDSYGVYNNEWYQHKLISERSGLLYGGLTNMEVNILKQYKESKKLIISEFNSIGSPTPKEVRNNFEKLFNLKWTGWVGRYFDNLSEANTELPLWLVKNYKRQHNYKWPFKKSGIAFVNENDQIEILDEGKDLAKVVPEIVTKKQTAEQLRLPEVISYPYWFDILQIDSTNTPLSIYHISATARGDSIMKRNGIPTTFPAVIEHYENDYKFYYFAGDFADNNISRNWSHFSGFPSIKSFFSSLKNGDRENFYWNYYYPLMSDILERYHDGLQTSRR